MLSCAYKVCMRKYTAALFKTAIDWKQSKQVMKCDLATKWEAIKSCENNKRVRLPRIDTKQSSRYVFKWKKLGKQQICKKNSIRNKGDAHIHMHMCVHKHIYTCRNFKERHTGNGTVVASREETSGPKENTFLCTVYFVVLLELFFNHEHFFFN